MITNRKFTVAFAICFLLYLLPEIFANDAMLYITGGVIGGTIQEVFKYFDYKPSDYLVEVLWILILLYTIFIFYLTQNKPLKYFIILLIAFLLYVIDFIFFEMFPYGICNYYLTGGVRILLKGLLLSLTYYKGNKS